MNSISDKFKPLKSGTKVTIVKVMGNSVTYKPVGNDSCISLESDNIPLISSIGIIKKSTLNLLKEGAIGVYKKSLLRYRIVLIE